jgi:hypothetical protein
VFAAAGGNNKVRAAQVSAIAISKSDMDALIRIDHETSHGQALPFVPD